MYQEKQSDPLKFPVNMLLLQKLYSTLNSGN